MDQDDSKRLKRRIKSGKREGGSFPLATLSAIIFEAFPERLRHDLTEEELTAACGGYAAFISDGLPYTEEAGCRSCSPKVRVHNPSPPEGPLKQETTAVEIHEVNRPFIYESIRGYFTKKGYRILGAIHPLFGVRREEGRVAEFLPAGEGEEELFIALYLERIDDAKERKEIARDMEAILRCLSYSVGDFSLMRERITTLADEASPINASGSRYSGREVAAFLRWLAEDNFVVIGVRDYLISPAGKGYSLTAANDLGIFRDGSLPERIMPGLMDEVETILQARAASSRILSTDFCRCGGAIIYQLSPIEFFSIRTDGSEGGTVKETLLMGRLTRGSMQFRSDAIPLLRKKAQSIVDSIAEGAHSFEYREARALFNYLPKQELFYATTEQLKATIGGIMAAESDDEVNVHLRMGDGGRYAMVMVSISRNDNNYTVRKSIEQLLAESYRSEIAFWHHASTETRALLFYYFSAPGTEFTALPAAAISARIKTIAFGWEQRFYLALSAAFGHRASALYDRYVPSLGTLYRDSTRPDKAVSDVMKLEALLKDGPLQVALENDGAGRGTLKLYSFEPIPLMKILKRLENFGLYVTGEQAFIFEGLPVGKPCYLYNYALEDEPAELDRLERLMEDFYRAMLAMGEGRAEDDRLNRLLIAEGLGWRSLELLRTLRNYLLQLNRAMSGATVTETMVRCGHVSRLIHDLFLVRFNTERMNRKARTVDTSALDGEIVKAVNAIEGLADFQVFNTLLEIVRHTVRTNFFCRPEKEVISIKVASRELAFLSPPRPMAEIYVHSPAFEGVHLRGGPVSRGGIRWSDRGEDFRTEILGLMRTQMLKNSIIVPEGAKGGFFIKRTAFSSREEQADHMKGCYRAFIGALLDLTDNYVSGKEASPPGVIRYDGFDPYLVVAADKGTAAMSDTANEISKAHGFWLGDAFASGGGTGYDHKKEGITARGVWESVKRHFREMGIDVQKDPVTVVGIGDMSGDVFGNGMLLSGAIRLIAAFNHMHIFLDPDPDPAASFSERQRLFALPRSAWSDYDKGLISRGGGVYFRSAKTVPVSREMAEYLGTDRKEVTGEEMVRLLLKAKVDLLYNGGIGTYVKAREESHLDVGDKTNDAVRVNGGEVRARVIGEGGNLGMTQLGRLEYAASGGRCYTDAVDNSAGVNTSDHEVNLKIMLDHLIEKGEVGSVEERNEILREMTPQVCAKVLKNNYLQGAAISMDFLRAKNDPEVFVATLAEMERTLGLSRAEESIPAQQQIAEALEKGREVFSRPLLSVLTGYQKMRYFKQVLASSMTETFFVQRYLRDYFPDRVRRAFEPYLPEHRLKREIISTMIVNRVINRAGITLLPLLSAFTGRKADDVVKGYLIIENLLQAEAFREEVHGLDNMVDAALQYRYLSALEEVIAYALRWFITHQTEDRISFDYVMHYGDLVKSFQEGFWECMDETCRSERKEALERELAAQTALNVPEALAKRYLLLPFMKDVMDIIRVKEEHHYNFYETARLYLRVVDFFRIDWIVELLGTLRAADKWGTENIANLKHELKDHQNGIVVSVLNFKRKSEDLLEAFDHYIQEKGEEAALYMQAMDELRSEGKAGIISINVIVKKLSLFITRPDRESV